MMKNTDTGIEFNNVAEYQSVGQIYSIEVSNDGLIVRLLRESEVLETIHSLTPREALHAQRTLGIKMVTTVMDELHAEQAAR
jgi:hypothetical protein